MATARVIKLHNLGPLLAVICLSYGVLMETQLEGRSPPEILAYLSVK